MNTEYLQEKLDELCNEYKIANWEISTYSRINGNYGFELKSKIWDFEITTRDEFNENSNLEYLNKCLTDKVKTLRNFQIANHMTMR